MILPITTRGFSKYRPVLVLLSRGAGRTMSSASRIPRTMSALACAAETVQGTHLFKIDGYSLWGLGAGKFIQSAVFRVGGHDWCVYLYPDGVREDSKD